MKKYILDLTVTENLRLHANYVLLKLTSPSPLPEMLPGQFAEIRVDGSPATFFCAAPISINYVDRQRNESMVLNPTRRWRNQAIRRSKSRRHNQCSASAGKLLHNAWKALRQALIGRWRCRYSSYVIFRTNSSPREAASQPSCWVPEVTKDLLQLEQFAAYGEVYTTTEDGSHGEKGYVTQHSILK